MWTLIFLAFAQADDILADEAKGKKPAATKVAEPATVPPAAGVKSAEPAGAKSPDGKIPEPPKAGEKASTPPAAKADSGETKSEAAEPAKPKTWVSTLDEITNTGAMGDMRKGGFFMWPILVLGILALGVIIERSRALLMLTTKNPQLRQKVQDLLQEDRAEDALELCEREQGPVPAILGAGLRKYVFLRKLDYDPAQISEQVSKAMEDYAVHVVAALEKHLPILATVASAAPMIGFLGTVSGMVQSFRDIVAQMGEKNIVEAAAAGIEISLLTTVLGLIVGIPAFIGFNYFTSVTNTFVLDVQESAAELIETLTLQTALSDKQPA
ncbi:MAG: MotA/TolQ/ExbB proton channel family protein [Pirellulaceae bacterium]